MNKVIAVSLSFCFIAACFLPLYGADAPVSADDITALALKNNPGLLSAEQMAKSYESRSHKAWFLDNPTAGVQYMDIQGEPMNLFSPPGTNVTIGQKVPFPLKVIWNTGAMNAEADAYKYMYEMKRREVIKDSLTAYYELYRVMKSIEITKNASAILKQLSEIAFAKYNQGTASEQDVVKSDIEFSSLENSIVFLERQKRTNLQRLDEVTGGHDFAENEDINLEEPEVPVLKMGFDEISPLVSKSAPEIKSASAMKTAADNMKASAVAGYLPDFDLQYTKPVGPGATGYGIMVSIDLPLWFLNNQQSDIGEKSGMAEAKSKELDDTRNRILYEARDHFETIKADYRTLDLYKNKLIPDAEAALKSAMSAYQSKKTEFMSLLDSERMLLEMKNDYYMHLTEYLMHFRMLEELAGGNIGEVTKNEKK